MAKGRDREAWDRELRGHLRAVKTRRDLIFRLGRLAALDLEPGDGETVDSLQAACVQRWEGRMRSLTKAQAHLVVTLEARYFDQRAGASAALAQALGEKRA